MTQAWATTKKAVKKVRATAIPVVGQTLGRDTTATKRTISSRLAIGVVAIHGEQMLILARVLFYQCFLTFVLVSLVFINFPVYCGVKAMVLHMSFLNHFYPISFEDAYDNLKDYSRWRAAAIRNYPKDFEIVEDAFAAEEWYWYKCRYTNSRGVVVTEIDSFRVRWKPWEYYYEVPKALETIKKDEIELLKPTLNSIETDKAFKLQWELKEQLRKKITA